jgi:hypothetical protein
VVTVVLAALGAALSEEETGFVRSNTGVVALNPTRGMNVSMHLLCLCYPVQGVLLRRAVLMLKETYRICIIKLSP